MPQATFQARFWLSEDGRVQSSRPASNGKSWETVECLRVKLFPSQGEPFGSATPGGQLEMIIANPEVVALFRSVPIGTEFDAVFTLVAPPAPTPATPATPAQDTPPTPDQADEAGAGAPPATPDSATAGA